MKNLRLFAGISGVLAIVAVVALIAFQAAHSAPIFASPKYGPVADAPHAFTLKPGQGMRFGPVYPNGGNVRYDVSSTLPLSTGLVVEGGGSWPKNATCLESQVLNSVKSCTIPVQGAAWIFVQDNRTQGELVGKVLLGNHNAADDSRVSVTTYRWGCVADCVK
jgi:hypothetical protein